MRKTDIELSLHEQDFTRNTFIGYGQKEVEYMSTQDLMAVRTAIDEYLHTKRLKVRNANYLEAFNRINEELQRRSDPISELWNEARSLTTENSSDDTSSTQLIGKKSRRKTPFKRLEINVPSFLNDKPKSSIISQKSSEKKMYDLYDDLSNTTELSAYDNELITELKNKMFDFDLFDIETSSYLFNVSFEPASTIEI